MKKDWTMIIILIIVIGSIWFIVNRHPAVTPVETAKCIGKNSVLYSQLGCSHCEKQKEMFGENYQYLTVIDCFYETGKCSDIAATPTWIIKGEKYIGVQTIEQLKKLTGC